MAFWDRNDNGYRNNGQDMGDRARNLADRARNALQQGADRMQHGARGNYDRADYNAGRNNSWGGDSYGANPNNNMGGGYAGGRMGGNDYDRDMTYRSGQQGGMGRDLGYGYGTGDRDEAGRGSMNYDRGYGAARPSMPYDRGYGAAGNPGYDRGMGGGNRAQTDNGDPFGDRQNHTPIRVMRGREMGGMGGSDMSRGDYGDRGMMGRDRGSYDRGFGGGSQMDAGRQDPRNEAYGAYQNYQGYSGINDEPYYNVDDMNAGGGNQGPTYDSNYRNRRDRDWF
jgi:hypothetical protein